MTGFIHSVLPGDFAVFVIGLERLKDHITPGLTVLAIRTASHTHLLIYTHSFTPPRQFICQLMGVSFGLQSPDPHKRIQPLPVC